MSEEVDELRRLLKESLDRIKYLEVENELSELREETLKDKILELRRLVKNIE